MNEPWRTIKLALPERTALRLEEAIALSRLYNNCGRAAAVDEIGEDYLYDHFVGDLLARMPGVADKVERLEAVRKCGFRCQRCRHSDGVYAWWIADGWVVLCKSCKDAWDAGSWRPDELEGSAERMHAEMALYGYCLSSNATTAGKFKW